MMTVLFGSTFVFIGLFLMGLYKAGAGLFCGKACKMTVIGIRKKEIPCLISKDEVRYIYDVEVEMKGEKILTSYDEIEAPEKIVEIAPGTVKKMRYNRRSDKLYDVEGALHMMLFSIIGFFGSALLFAVLSNLN